MTATNHGLLSYVTWKVYVTSRFLQNNLRINFGHFKVFDNFIN